MHAKKPLTSKWTLKEKNQHLKALKIKFAQPRAPTYIRGNFNYSQRPSTDLGSKFEPINKLIAEATPNEEMLKSLNGEVGVVGKNIKLKYSASVTPLSHYSLNKVQTMPLKGLSSAQSMRILSKYKAKVIHSDKQKAVIDNFVKKAGS